MSGVVASAVENNYGYNDGGVSTSLDFIGPTATVSVGSGERIFISASKALGTSKSSGAWDLKLYVCHRRTGTTVPTTIGSGMAGLRVTQWIHIPFALSAATGALDPDSYEVGMCGFSPQAETWNLNEYGYVTALVFKQ